MNSSIPTQPKNREKNHNSKLFIHNQQKNKTKHDSKLLIRNHFVAKLAFLFVKSPIVS